MNQMPEYFLNAFLTSMRKREILKEVNEALEMRQRVLDQIKIWEAKPVDNLCTKIVQDELTFLRYGRV